MNDGIASADDVLIGTRTRWRVDARKMLHRYADSSGGATRQDACAADVAAFFDRKDSKMKKKSFVAVLLLLAGVVAAGIATANYPPDGVQYAYSYYSKTGDLVGGEIIGCGDYYSWGEKTSRMRMRRSDCGF